MVEVKFYDSIDDSLLKFAVIITKTEGKWVFCKHRERDTYEVPGGHRECGETILETAKRELREETGAIDFNIKPICVYSVKGKTRANENIDEEIFGMLYYAEVFSFEELHSEIEKIVKDAIAADTIMVYYQPIYSVKKKCYNSAEALARLYDEKLGWIPPVVFITTAEKCGLIIELGELILHKVCRFIKENELSKTSVEYIEVNVSPLQLMQKGFADKMLGIMKQYDVAPSQINVEITETAMMASFAIVDENLTKLIDNKIAISLDDYGSGYATINYINKIPFELIKIDRMIIQDAFKERKAGITLAHTVSMLNALELSIVAEGVETEDMRDILIDFGCQYLQGWYYSKAVSETEFMQLINKGA